MIIEKDLFYYPWENSIENNCNSYIIGGDVTVLVDAGHLKHLGRLFASMEKDGLSPQGLYRSQAGPGILTIQPAGGAAGPTGDQPEKGGTVRNGFVPG